MLHIMCDRKKIDNYNLQSSSITFRMSLKFNQYIRLVISVTVFSVVTITNPKNIVFYHIN